MATMLGGFTILNESQILWSQTDVHSWLNVQ